MRECVRACVWTLDADIFRTGVQVWVMLEGLKRVAYR